MEKKFVREIPKISLVDAPRCELTVTVQDENDYSMPSSLPQTIDDISGGRRHL